MILQSPPPLLNSVHTGIEEIRFVWKKITSLMRYIFKVILKISKIILSSVEFRGDLAQSIKMLAFLLGNLGFYQDWQVFGSVTV